MLPGKLAGKFAPVPAIITKSPAQPAINPCKSRE